MLNTDRRFSFKVEYKRGVIIMNTDGLMSQVWSNKKPGVAVIGCGYWGTNYVRIFDRMPEAQLVAICDQRPERQQELKTEYPNVAVLGDLTETIQMSEVDVVIICTGATTHYAVTKQCLEAGKHVLVEKPMATTVADSRALIRIARENNVTLMVGHTFLYNAAVEKVAELVNDGQDSNIYYLYSRRTNMGPIRTDVNAVWDLAPHDVSIFNHFVKQAPQWVSAVGVKALNTEREDAAFISLVYPNGIVGNIHISWVDPNKVRELVVVCSDKRIVFDDLNALERVKVFEKGVVPTTVQANGYGAHQFYMRDGDIFSPRITMSEPLKNQCLHFLQSIRTNQLPLTDGQAGLEVVEVMEAIERSMELNGAPVYLDSSMVNGTDIHAGKPVLANGHLSYELA